MWMTPSLQSQNVHYAAGVTSEIHLVGCPYVSPSSWPIVFPQCLERCPCFSVSVMLPARRAHVWDWAFVCVLRLRTCCLVHKEDNEKPFIVLVECGRRRQCRSMSSSQMLGTSVQSACTMTHHSMRETGKQKDRKKERRYSPALLPK